MEDQMTTKLAVKWYSNDKCEYHALYRKGTSDEGVLKEVIDNCTYKRSRLGFDVEQGETWLDLGANIGAFAIYCLLHKAKVVCYEPDPESYDILLRNMSFTTMSCYNVAVTNRQDKELWIYHSPTEGNYARTTLFPPERGRYARQSIVKNVYAGGLGGFDGVKMDIEGAEFGIIDDGLVPKCNKLVLEYHTSRDTCMDNLSRRLKVLRSLFKVVHAPDELLRLAEQGGKAKTYFDRLIHCKGWKS